MKRNFSNAVSYNRFAEPEQRVFFKLVFFLKLFAFGRCTGISFVDSTMIPYVTIQDVMPTRYSKGWLPMAKAQWAGGKDSSFICCVMTEEKS